MSDFNAGVISEFRANHGRVGGPLEGIPLVLVTHTGARTGQTRTTPLGYFDDGDTLILFASNLGAPGHPAWFHNIAANPSVTVEVGDERFDAAATILQGDDRHEVWTRLVLARPFLIDHQEKAGRREIPLIALYRLPQ